MGQNYGLSLEGKVELYKTANHVILPSQGPSQVATQQFEST